MNARDAGRPGHQSFARADKPDLGFGRSPARSSGCVGDGSFSEADAGVRSEFQRVKQWLAVENPLA